MDKPNHHPHHRFSSQRDVNSFRYKPYRFKSFNNSFNYNNGRGSHHNGHHNFRGQSYRRQTGHRVPKVMSSFEMPAEWNSVPDYGGRIFRFIPFKLPLIEYNFPVRIDRSEFRAFPIEKVLTKYPKMKMIINLSEHTTYDDIFLRDKFNIDYVSIPSNDIIPPEVSQSQFNVECREFLRQNPDSYIGVHCTNGVDQTGFLICKYLIEFELYTPATAVVEFTKVRGYKMSPVVQQPLNDFYSSFAAKRKATAKETPTKKSPPPISPIKVKIEKKSPPPISPTKIKVEKKSTPIVSATKTTKIKTEIPDKRKIESESTDLRSKKSRFSQLTAEELSQWKEHSKFGSTVGETFFVPFKAPFCRRHLPNYLEEDNEDMEDFEVEELLNARPEIGLIIDLTDGLRTYTIKQLTADREIKYLNIACSGSADNISDTHYEHFQKAYMDFQQENPGKMVGVHCLTGSDHTRMMTCRFLEFHFGITAEDAVTLFGDARKDG